MKTLKSLFLLFNLLIFINKNYAQAPGSCLTNNSSKATLTLPNSSTYNSNSATSPTSVPSVVSGTVLTFSQNVNCVSYIQPSNHPPAFTEVAVYNPPVLQASIGSFLYLGNHTTPNLTTTATGLGIKKYIVYANCGVGVNNLGNWQGGLIPVPVPGNACPIGSFNINITAPPFSATFSQLPKINYYAPTNSYTFTGWAFSINITTTPMYGTTLNLYKSGNLLVSKPFPLATGANIFDNGGPGYGAGTYQIKFMNNGIEIFPTGNTASYTIII